MPPSSNIPKGTNIIWDDTDLGPDPGEDGAEFAGYEGRDWEAEPYGSVASALPESYLLTDDEILAIIQEKRRTGGGLRKMLESMGLPPLHQARTNYCWINALIDALQIDLAKQGFVVRLSPASAGAPMTGYRNVGGWVSRAIVWVKQHGVVPVDLWPANAIDKRYDTAEVREARKKYGIAEVFDVPPRNMRAIHSLLCRDIPVAGGYNWMRHAVTPIESVVLDGQLGTLCRNSGYMRDSQGYTVLMGSRAIPDEAVCIRTAFAAA